MKLLFEEVGEEVGGAYTQVGDYFLPDLKLPKKEQSLSANGENA